jgi:hypothetical protein
MFMTKERRIYMGIPACCYIQKTIESNNLNNIKRVHSGTANEDTLEDLINDVVSFLENLTEQLKENENE